MKTDIMLDDEVLLTVNDELKQVKVDADFWINQTRYVVARTNYSFDSVSGGKMVIHVRDPNISPEQAALETLFSLRPSIFYRVKGAETLEDKAEVLKSWIETRVSPTREVSEGHASALENWTAELLKQQKAPFASAIGMLRDAGITYVNLLRSQRDDLEATIHVLREKIDLLQRSLRGAKAYVLPFMMADIDEVLES